MIDRNFVPDPAVKRLSLYLRQLEQLVTEGVDRVSSMTLAETLDINSAQVRKDLAYWGQFGQAGVGYDVVALIEQARRILGTDRMQKIIVVGAGNLGRAVMRDEGLLGRGFQPVAAFDISRAKVGKRVNGVPVHPIDDLPDIVRENNVKLAVLAVPAQAAQPAADMLCQAGVTAILNLTRIAVQTPPGVSVGMVDLAADLERLSYHLTCTRSIKSG